MAFKRFKPEPSQGNRKKVLGFKVTKSGHLYFWRGTPVPPNPVAVYKDGDDLAIVFDEKGTMRVSGKGGADTLSCASLCRHLKGGEFHYVSPVVVDGFPGHLFRRTVK